MEKSDIKAPMTPEEYADALAKIFPADYKIPDKIETGWRTLSDLKTDEDIESLKEKIKGVVSTAGKNLPPEKRKELAKMLFKIATKGISPKDAMGISPNEMAEIYGFAFSMFSAGKYNESKELFKMLLTLEPTNSNFATSVGTCYHRLQDYEGALAYYLTAMGINQLDPVPSFYAYDCFLKLNCEPWALIMLEYTIIRAGEQERYAKMRDKAIILAAPLEEKMTEQFLKGVDPQKR